LFNLTILFLLLFLSWIVFLGVFSTKYLLVGVACCAIALASYRLIYKDKINGMPYVFIRMCGYCIWLIKEIATSSFALSLKMWQLEPEISPKALWITVNLRDDLAMAIFANSITLTPGTVAIGTREGMVYVHCLTEEIMNNFKLGSVLERVYRTTKIEKE
jgi:multicomponent Na+:H+ antiporter subunit E